MNTKGWVVVFSLSLSFSFLSGCSSIDRSMPMASGPQLPANYMDRMPQTIPEGGRVVVVDPNVFTWGAYENGTLVRAGLATAGADWCVDTDQPCRTTPGSFRIFSLGDASCKSSKFPVPHGGAHMPYCMYFNGGQALHGSDEAVPSNVSHGCVRMEVADAEWMRYNFANVGTKVIVKPYN